MLEHAGILLDLGGLGRQPLRLVVQSLEVAPKLLLALRLPRQVLAKVIQDPGEASALLGALFQYGLILGEGLRELKHRACPGPAVASTSKRSGEGTGGRQVDAAVGSGTVGERTACEARRGSLAHSPASEPSLSCPTFGTLRSFSDILSVAVSGGKSARVARRVHCGGAPPLLSTASLTSSCCASAITLLVGKDARETSSVGGSPKPYKQKQHVNARKRT